MTRIASVGLVLLALVLLPTPLLPPHRLAEAVQSLLGFQWKAAYLLATIGLQSVIYFALGLLAAFAVTRAKTPRGRALQVVIVPLVTIGASLLVRSLLQGHFPVWVNAMIPIVACLCGVWFGLGLLSRQPWMVLLLLVPMVGGVLWVLVGTASTGLSRHTEQHLRQLVSAGSHLPTGDSRFMAVLRAAFAPVVEAPAPADAVQQNRAAILALGIAVGHTRLARLVGLDPSSDLVRTACESVSGTTLRGRDDWSRHFCLSAALAVLEHPLVSDAGGLMKEQVDALARGSGFSFGDLAADRAGVRFAEVATQSEVAAMSIRTRLLTGASSDDIFPRVADLPENLTVEQFRHNYGSVGSPRYRRAMDELEARLDSCAMLSPP